jgi:hypothetical protein
LWNAAAPITEVGVRPRQIFLPMFALAFESDQLHVIEAVIRIATS